MNKVIIRIEFSRDRCTDGGLVFKTELMGRLRAGRIHKDLQHFLIFGRRELINDLEFKIANHHS